MAEEGLRYMQGKKVFFSFMCAMAILPLLAGCLPVMPTLPVALPPTSAKITLMVSPDVNPDVRGRPSPVVVRIYELKTANPLLRADAMSFFNKDAAILGTDKLSRLEYTLSPGQSQHISIEMKPEARGIGFVVLYRDYLNSVWQDYIEIPPYRTTSVVALIGANTIALSIPKQ